MIRTGDSEPKFKSIDSQINLPSTIKDGAYVLNLDESKST